MRILYKLKWKIINRIKGTLNHGLKYLYSEKFRKRIKNRKKQANRRKYVRSGFLSKVKKHKARIATYAGSKCNLCRNDFELKDLTIDHIICAKDGGSSEYQNLQLLCLECHRIKDGKVKKLST